MNNSFIFPVPLRRFPVEFAEAMDSARCCGSELAWLHSCGLHKEERDPPQIFSEYLEPVPDLEKQKW